jgi:long-chain acyl-CoA synthetase
MLSHRNLLFLAAGSARIRSLTTQDRFYGVLPMSHAVGLSVVLLGSLLSGATLYLAARFDPMTARRTIENERLTVILAAPIFFNQFLQYAKLRGLQSLKFPALRIIASSGAQLHASTKSATESLFGMPLHNGYGVTECSPTIAQTRVEAPRSDTSIGPPFPGVEVKLAGPDGKPVPEGEAGELWVRGPNVMKGYYRDLEATAAAIDAEGWFNTRDLARMDGGNLYIVGRTKDLIVRHGFNVYPAEVEAVLNAHPAVAHSGVIPNMPLTPTGKVVKAELAKLLDNSCSLRAPYPSVAE